MHHWLLWSQFVALNMVGVAGLFLVWVNGWVNRILIADSSGISVLIFALFLVGLIASGWRINKVTQELDNLRNGKGPLEEGGRLASYRRALETGGSSATRALELRLFSRIAFIRHIANVLVLLGLVGTVVGFIVALANVNAQTASDVNAIGGMVGLADRRHGHSALHHAGRIGPEPLAGGQLPASRHRHRQSRRRSDRRRPCLTHGTAATIAERSSGM